MLTSANCRISVHLRLGSIFPRRHFTMALALGCKATKMVHCMKLVSNANVQEFVDVLLTENPEVRRLGLTITAQAV